MEGRATIKYTHTKPTTTFVKQLLLFQLYIYKNTKEIGSGEAGLTLGHLRRVEKGAIGNKIGVDCPSLPLR